MVAAAAYNKAEHWLHIREAPEKYQFYQTQLNFKVLLKIAQSERVVFPPKRR